MELLIGVVRFPVSPLVPSCLDGCKKKSRYRLIPNFSLVGLNLNKIQLASTVSAPGMHRVIPEFGGARDNIINKTSIL